MLTKRNKVERMTIVNTLLTSIYEELLEDEVDDIDGLLQIAVYAQVEMNRIVFDLNQRNGCEPTADTPQTDCPVAVVFGCDECHRPKCDYKNCRRCKWFVTDKCHECFGNELFEDSGYVTQTERSE